MRTTRRSFIKQTAGGLAGAAIVSNWAVLAQAAPKLRMSACDWSLRMENELGALEVAKGIGLDGVEISVGAPADRLQIADKAHRQKYKEVMGKTGMVVSSTAMGLLNGCPVASHDMAPAWIEQTIDATKDLGATVILLPFFVKGDLRGPDGLKAKDIDAVVGRLKDLAPKAKKAGVVLGIENTLSTKDNLKILDRIQHDAVQIYYDIGNSTGFGYDVPTEIRDLSDRICMFHFKDNKGYLGEGEVEMAPVAEAIADINYKGWIVLETWVGEDRDADFKKNAAYTHKLLGMA